MRIVRLWNAPVQKEVPVSRTLMQQQLQQWPPVLQARQLVQLFVPQGLKGLAAASLPQGVHPGRSAPLAAHQGSSPQLVGRQVAEHLLQDGLRQQLLYESQLGLCASSWSA